MLVLTDERNLRAIAEAIRERGHLSEGLLPSEMAEAIASMITSGPGRAVHGGGDVLVATVASASSGVMVASSDAATTLRTWEMPHTYATTATRE